MCVWRLRFPEKMKRSTPDRPAGAGNWGAVSSEKGGEKNSEFEPLIIFKVRKNKIQQREVFLFIFIPPFIKLNIIMI